MMQSTPEGNRKYGHTLCVAAILAAAPFALCGWWVRSYVDPGHSKVARAGFVEKTAQVNGVALRYVEGPNNGPPLVLLHAQLLDWFSYNQVLPELAKSFHVYDIDYPGHGRTTVPPGYPMTADRIGSDLGDFIAQEIRMPVYITGNSSGGLLAVWLAANRPALIRAALLEDPPLFSSEFPRIQKTIAYHAFATSYQAETQDHPRDFLTYWVRSNAQFFRNHVARGIPTLLSAAVRFYRSANPGKPVELGFLRNPTVRMLVRGLGEYDPAFGSAFYDGTWNRGFDHAAALQKIACPVLLLQANSTTLPNGVLNGAMDHDDAQRALALLRNGSYVKVDASHVVHLDKPGEFLRILKAFFATV